MLSNFFIIRGSLPLFPVSSVSCFPSFSLFYCSSSPSNSLLALSLSGSYWKQCSLIIEEFRLWDKLCIPTMSLMAFNKSMALSKLQNLSLNYLICKMEIMRRQTTVCWINKCLAQSQAFVNAHCTLPVSKYNRIISGCGLVVDVTYILNRNRHLGAKTWLCLNVMVGDSFRWYAFLFRVESFV